MRAHATPNARQPPSTSALPSLPLSAPSAASPGPPSTGGGFVPESTTTFPPHCAPVQSPSMGGCALEVEHPASESETDSATAASKVRDFTGGSMLRPGREG